LVLLNNPVGLGNGMIKKQLFKKKGGVIKTPPKGISRGYYPPGEG
jgi:hypothetical protein